MPQCLSSSLADPRTEWHHPPEGHTGSDNSQWPWGAKVYFKS